VCDVIDEEELGRVKSISALSAHSAVKGLKVLSLSLKFPTFYVHIRSHVYDTLLNGYLSLEACFRVFTFHLQTSSRSPVVMQVTNKKKIFMKLDTNYSFGFPKALWEGYLVNCTGRTSMQFD